MRSVALALHRVARNAERGFAVAAILSLLAAATLATARPAAAKDTLRIDFIDVGQGDAALVTSPTGKTVLVDAGPRRSSAAVTTFLTRHVLHPPLDLLLLSHRHEDHVGGMPEVVREIGARQFMDAAFPHQSAAYTALMRELDVRKIRVLQATRGRVIDLGGGARITLLGPPEPVIHGSRSDVNANSVVVRLTFGTFAVLLTGDAEAPTETWLLASGAPLGASVLKVAHHGSRYSSGPAFLDAVDAKIAVVSVGRVNDYGHPAEGTLARIAGHGASVFRTDTEGDISIETDGTSMQVRAASGRKETFTPP